MIPDEEYVQLYELFKKLMDESGTPDQQKLVIYHPDLFIEMANEIIRLRKDNRTLKIAQGNFIMQSEYANRLLEQLRCIKRDLDDMGIRLPYKFK